MNFSLNIICKNEIAEEKEAEVKALLDALRIEGSPAFEPYWKDRSLSRLAFGAQLATPDFALIKAHLCAIARAEVSLSSSLEEWEFSHYASVEELASGKSEAFIVCEVF